MADCLSYACDADMLPVVETTLALNGYRVELPWQRSVGGANALVMVQGLSSILLVDDPAKNSGVIEVWGVPLATAAHLIESLPIDLIKQSCH